MFSKFVKLLSRCFPFFRSTSTVHLISVKPSDFAPPKVSSFSLSVVKLLQSKGFDAYLVGGAVRDILIGRTPKDFDVVTNASPEEVVTFFRRARVIGRRFKIVHVIQGKEIVEVSTFRRASDQECVDEHGRILNDNCYGSQQEDANRRDFTINGLYLDPQKSIILDFHKGMSDLNARLIRVIGHPLTRYREDPVRMLRAVRFAVKLGFEIEESSLAIIQELFPLLEHVPPARIFDELVKILFSSKAWLSCQKLRALGKVGILPLVDYIIDNPRPDFVQYVLSYTDARVRARKHVSLSFLLSTILWGYVSELALSLQEQGKKTRFAFHCAMDTILSDEFPKLGVPRRFAADVREICSLQIFFTHRNRRQIMTLLEKKRFSAAYDFFLLRAQVKEVDEPIKSWWVSFIAASKDEKEVMLSSLRDNKEGRKDQNRRRSRASSATRHPTDHTKV